MSFFGLPWTSSVLPRMVPTLVIRHFEGVLTSMPKKGDRTHKYKPFTKEVPCLGHDYPSWLAQLWIYDQIVLWGHFWSLDMSDLLQRPLLIHTPSSSSSVWESHDCWLCSVVYIRNVNVNSLWLLVYNHWWW